MLAMANIRGNKSQATGLLIFMWIATMCLSAGLVLYFDFSGSFDERAEQLNAPHLALVQQEAITTEEQFDWLEKNALEAERYPVIAGAGGYYSQNVESHGVLIFTNADERQSMNPPTLIGKSLPLDDESIYVPYIMKSLSGYELGDEYKLNLSGEGRVYTIAGFTEEVIFNAPMNLIYRFYVNDSEYGKLRDAFPEYQCVFFGIRLRDSGRVAAFASEYNKEFMQGGDAKDRVAVTGWTTDYEGAKANRSMIPMMLAMILTAFAIILLVVCLVNIRFVIVNNIEENMVNIGALKAVGYRNHQIVASILLQFGGVAAVGGVAGIVASSLLMPILSDVMETQSAMVWNPGFHTTIAAATMGFAELAVLLVSLHAARRIFRLHPLTALRGGMETHSFKKNGIPLDASHGPLPFLLAMKRLLRTKGQSVMILLIMASVTYASVTGVAIYYNIGVKTNEFVASIVGEVPDVVLGINDKDEADALVKRLRERGDVRKAIGYGNVDAVAEDEATTSLVVKDCDELEGFLLIGGRYPKHDNEMAASDVFMKLTGKKIGDEVSVGQGADKKDFFISGRIQSIVNNENGNVVLMTYDGFTSVYPEYKFNQIYVYLKSNVGTPDFIERIRSDEGALIVETIDMQDLVDANFGSMSGVFAIVATVILIITIVVVVLVLYLVIKTLILHRKREFGIQKAVGFTTFQIMNQIALGLAPVTLFGVVLGGVSGIALLGALIGLLVEGMGVARVNVTVPVGWTVATCIILWTLSYTVSMLVARRIRRISAYALVSE